MFLFSFCSCFFFPQSLSRRHDGAVDQHYVRTNWWISAVGHAKCTVAGNIRDVAATNVVRQSRRVVTFWIFMSGQSRIRSTFHGYSFRRCSHRRGRVGVVPISASQTKEKSREQNNSSS